MANPTAPEGMPGAGLTSRRAGQAGSDRLALKPYWGEPAVRNFRGGGGDVGIIRSPVRATALPDPRPVRTYTLVKANGTSPIPPSAAAEPLAALAPESPSRLEEVAFRPASEGERVPELGRLSLGPAHFRKSNGIH